MQNRFRCRIWNNLQKEMYYGVGFIYVEPFIHVDCGYTIKMFTINEVKPMQCTGMLDDNDKLIYEGDIVEIWKMKGNIQKKMIVKWRDTQCSFRLYDLSAMGATPQKIVSPEKRSMGAVTSIKIIGNVYENPELLENNK